MELPPAIVKSQQTNKAGPQNIKAKSFWLKLHYMLEIFISGECDHLQIDNTCNNSGTVSSTYLRMNERLAFAFSHTHIFINGQHNYTNRKIKRKDEIWAGEKSLLLLNWSWSFAGKCLLALATISGWPLLDKPCKKIFLASNCSPISDSGTNPFGAHVDLHSCHFTNIFAALSASIDLAIKNRMSVVSPNSCKPNGKQIKNTRN